MGDGGMEGLYVRRVEHACSRAMTRLSQAEDFISDAIAALQAADASAGSPEREFRLALINVRTDVFVARQAIVEKSDDYYEQKGP